MAAGVDFWNYQRSMLHAKVLTADGVVATIGSGNMDQRSMRLNEECNVVLFDRDLVAELDAHFTDDLERSEQIEPQRWAHRGIAQRAKEILTKPVDQKL